MNIYNRYYSTLGKRLEKKKIDATRYTFLIGILNKWQNTQDKINRAAIQK